MFWLLEPSICHCCKVGYKFVYSVCEHMSWWNRVLSNCFDVLNPNKNHFCFWLSGKSSNIKQYGFLICEPSFCHCCKVGWELVSGMWEYMNYWKRVFSNSFDVLNPNIKSCLLFVEWKIIKHKIICVFVTWTTILSLL